ncbi:NADPH-dependent FMN reductase [Kribbella shirazensis]|uniref:NAD(P)H-dependent FMN reductase n=1 Tax=Kribbella shirazensis TaxID=1105143 RepID=A0A7X5VBR4_9ACTN|nr:NAD(P)H-dependent oxidoreductase [Kribbella shirazensis]NIK58269.1 NAD(P)H-dependent FMN reductase [Kribbella shirazensis]
MRLTVIIGSTRRGRFGPTVANWLAQQAAKQFEVDLVDLAAANLPATLPDTDDETPQEVAELSTRLAAADAFALVTPEINCSFPASLKTALDWYYEEWHAKPVAIVSYGREGGGSLATAQLRQVFTELQAVTIRNTVTMPCYWEQFTADGGWPKPSAGYEAAAKLMLDQLVWWAAALQDARKRRPYQA